MQTPQTQQVECNTTGCYAVHHPQFILLDGIVLFVGFIVALFLMKR